MVTAKRGPQLLVLLGITSKGLQPQLAARRRCLPSSAGFTWTSQHPNVMLPLPHERARSWKGHERRSPSMCATSWVPGSSQSD